MKLTPGSKRTEVGVIPGDWDVTAFGEFAQFRNGLNFVKSDRGDIVKVLGVSDFQSHFRVSFSSLDSVQISGSLCSDDLLENGDLLFVRSNGNKALIGRCVIIDGLNEPVAFSGFTIRARITSVSASSEYVGRYFQSNSAKRQIKEAGEGSHISNLSQQVLASLKLPVPKRSEQEAIAGALSDVDGLIGALEKLIAKKRAIKQAAMQQLLTAKTRLPGFADKWTTKTLGDLGPFLKGSGVKKDQAKSGPFPCIRYGEIYTNHNDYIRGFHSWISREVADGATPLECGDILFAGSGETKEEIGKAVAFVGSSEAYAGGDIVILRAKEIDPIFVGYLCNSPAVREQKASKGQGDAVVHISSSALASVSVVLPALPEQVAIADVLTDMDAEIEMLERRRDKTTWIKQGMMQQLLTGRIRLIKPAPSAPVEAGAKPGRAHSWAFNEAVVIANLAKQFGKDEFPLGRKRYTKLSYLLHRHVERNTEGYLKKAAGPYNPRTKYGGPERIALESGYLREHKNGPYSGFVPGDKVTQAEDYFEKWYGNDTKQWLEQFRFRKNDELELLATVDMAAEELRAAGQPVDVEAVKMVIRNHPDWQAKLDRPVFSDTNIASAIRESEKLFGLTGG